MRRRSDGLFVGLSVLHGAALVTVPSAPLIAIGIWWNSNTIAHNFIHRPFFRERTRNVLFSFAQSLLMGIPQTLWRERHLAHHADVRWRARWSGQLVVEFALVVGLWTALVIMAPAFFVTTYLPGYAAGLVLCALHGHYEHAGRTTTSHYGRIYNWLCFNDGYHVEHHAFPGLHWTDLPARAQSDAPTSRWPAPLRWIDSLSLAGLERLVLRSATLQRFVLDAHRSAFESLLSEIGPCRNVTIVGGGLFPRTALVLSELLPDADLTVIEANTGNLAVAQAFLERAGDSGRRRVAFRHERFPNEPDADATVDLLVVPLAFEGDRDAVYAHPPARAVVVHDWIWRRRGRGRIVSLLLLKRLNLVTQACSRAC